MKKTISAFLAAATVAGSLVAITPPANAQGRGVAAGLVGGLILGTVVGAAAANAQPRPYYGQPAYVEGPPCRLVRERFWDGYGWRVRRIEVCD